MCRSANFRAWSRIASSLKDAKFDLCSIHRSRPQNSSAGMNLQFIRLFLCTIFNTFISILLFCLFSYNSDLEGHMSFQKIKSYLQPCLADAWLPPPSHRLSGLRENNKFHYDTLVCCSLSRGGTCDSSKFFKVKEDRCCRFKETHTQKI